MDEENNIWESNEPQQEARELGKLLDSYMRFRAEQEGVGYELMPEFYETHILAGIEGFFNVTFAKGKLVADTEFPAIFQEWKQKEQNISNGDSERCEDGGNTLKKGELE